ncbi:MAG: aminodeoxychorismate lyase [Verrucomicrobiales bacterium]|nr:aminodeoxychorismate lyase [Verrucomicrobiales bacterium]
MTESDSRVWFQGRMIPQEEAVVPVSDRSFLYGDGLFESVRIHGGVPFLWPRHLERLRAGAGVLGIRIPFSDEELSRGVHDLIRHHHTGEAMLRVTLSRGSGPRGYSPRGADQPRVVMTLHALASALTGTRTWTLATSSLRVAPGDPLARFKTANKLVQVLSRREAEEAGADEALVLNTQGHVVEAASGSLFWIESGTVCTPPLDAGCLAGITRGVVLELAAGLGVPKAEPLRTVAELRMADGVFLAMSSLGIVPVSHLDAVPLSASPLTDRLRRAYEDFMNASRTP